MSGAHAPPHPPDVYVFVQRFDIRIRLDRLDAGHRSKRLRSPELVQVGSLRGYALWPIGSTPASSSVDC